MMNQDIIFYSNYCKFSQDLIKYITKQDLKNMFVFVCVDKNKHKIPNQVDRVPALFLAREKRILFEDDIFKCIEQSVQSINPMEQPSSSFSDNFAFVENDAMQPNQLVDSKMFARFGEEQRIYTPEDDSGNKNDNEQTLERFNAQRDNDITSVFGDRRRPM
jgi:hypothetical protein